MFSKSKVLGCLLVLTLVALALGGRARADVIAVALTPNPTTTFNNGAGYSLGYEFLANSNMTVTQLGYFAPEGLTENHTVGIYSTGGILLTSATVTTSDPVTANFAYDATLSSPLTLIAGTDYYIVGTSGFADVYTFEPTSFSTNPALTFITDAFTYGYGNSLAFPTVTNDGGSPGYFGPNFEFSVAAVPEPSTLVLTVLAFTSLGFFRWYKCKQTAPAYSS